MNRETLKALRGSIKKWEKIVAGTGEDDGCNNCPLCDLFFNKTGSCFGCPVMDKTGRDECVGTPYGAWRWTHEDNFPLTADTPEQKTAARRELKFLKSLLPKDARK